MDSAMSSMSSMPSMPSSTAMASMSGMAGMTTMNGMTKMPASMMSMTLFTSTSTPIYSAKWMPTTVGQYAGTCIFLILLAIIFRGLLAAKTWKETRWLDAEFKRRYVTVAGKEPKSESIASDPDAKRMILSENGIEEDVIVVRKKGPVTRPWRFSVDPIRAAMDTVIAGVGYLLMLAIMTMNVGYFLSILGGTFLGSLIVGRYTGLFQH